MKTRAFTLIELLVVISVIAVLMAVLMPSLRLAKQQAASGRCLSNTKNLALGWYMHMQDNDGKMNRYAMNRHSQGVNCVFLDQSAQRIKIKELWSLKWHTQFDVHNKWTLPDVDWPDWIK